MGAMLITMTYQAGLLIRVVYALCLLGATFNHASALVQHGVFWDYGGFPLASCVFWTSLTILDPLAVCLLYLHPRAGLGMTLAIIASDVAHNLSTSAFYLVTYRVAFHRINYLPLALQSTFLVFVILTIRPAWPEASPVRRCE